MRTYSEKLKDPRWQRRRLEIMQRDSWRCRKCGDGSTSLNVHHDHYINGLEPWEYPADLLITLCEPCHEKQDHATGKWGNWRYDAASRTLNFKVNDWFTYDVPIEQVKDAPGRQRWINHLSVKRWLTPADLEDFEHAIDGVLVRA